MASDAVVDLVVNAAGADTAIVRDIRRIAGQAERAAPPVELRVDLDTRGLHTTIREEGLRARVDMRDALGGVADVVTASLEQNFRRLGETLSAELQAVSRQAESTNVHLERLDRTVRDLDRDADRIDGDGIRDIGDDSDDSDRKSSRLLGTLLSFGKAAGGIALSSTRILSIASVASTAIPVVAGLVAELTAMAPAAAIGVSGFVTLQAASATLKLGLSGVSDALSEVFALDQDPKKLAKALENLSPNARDFVRELQGMRKEFMDLRLDVQDRLFKNLDTTVQRVGKEAFPLVQKAAQSFSDTFNRMGVRVGNTAVTLSQNGALGQALKGSTDAFADLVDLPGQVLNAIVKLAAGGAPGLNRITSGIAKIGNDLTLKLNKAAESGGLDKVINAAIDTVLQLGRVIGNVFGTIGNVLSVASESGNGLFGTLEKVTGALEEGSRSKVFQDTLTSMISLGTTLVTSILPLLTQAFAAIAPVIQLLVPPLQELVTLLADRLSDVITELGPVLQQVAVTFGLLLTALTPLVDEGLKALILSLPFLIDLFTQVGVLITELTPVIAELAPLIGVTLVGAIVILVEASATVIAILANLVDAVKTVVRVVIDLATTLYNVLVQSFEAIINLLQGDFSGAWQNVKNIVSLVLGFIGRALVEFGGLVLRTIGRLVDLLPSGARRAFDGLVNAAKNGVANTVVALAALGSRAVAVISSYAGRFYAAGRGLVSGFVSGIKSMISSAIGAAKSLVSSVTDFLPGSPAKRGPLSGAGYSLIRGRSLSQDFARGIMSQSPLVNRAISSVLGPSLGMTAPALSLAGSGLSSSGGSGVVTPQIPSVTNRFTPTINVAIGNDRLSRYIQNVVDENDFRRDRLAAQGTGR